MKIIKDMPAHEYHAIKALSSTGIREFIRSPAHFKYRQDNGVEQTTDMALGTAYHKYVLELDDFYNCYVVPPKCDKRTKEGKETFKAFEAENEGKTHIDREDLDKILSMYDVLTSNKTAVGLFMNATTELTLLWDDVEYGFPCKARLDAVRIVKGIHCISDLKTTTDASPVGFGKQVFNRGYDVQAAWYYNAYVAAIGRDIDCRSFLVAQEKSGVKAVATYEVTEPVLQLGTSKINAVKAQYAECLQSDKWAAYPEVTELTIPAWAGV